MKDSMIIKLLKWFLKVLEDDGYDLREVKGKMHMAIDLLEHMHHYTDTNGLEHSYHKYDAEDILPFVIGEEVADE